VIPLRHDPTGIPVALVDLLHLHRILDLAMMSLAFLITPLSPPWVPPISGFRDLSTKRKLLTVTE
tara:strand:+ start:133 stop:327 length:195 start_codon:yes stop_codon:yes gene_type:complete